MKIFNRFLLYLAIGMLCSLIPFLHVSLAIGFPAVLLNSIILTFIYNKDLKGYESDCGLEVKIYPVIRLSCAWVWTIDSMAISAYAFSFRKGYHYSTLMLTKKNFRALPVRTIK